MDETFVQLNIYGKGKNSSELRGLINWFAVHATSMDGSNTLISGDNKGVASLILEKEMNPGQLVGKVLCKKSHEPPMGHLAMASSNS